MENNNEANTYEGFELGPIRPPSEASSLMLRITRNCPWNKCKFCGLYRGEKFNIRSVEHVKQDIDTVKLYVDKIKQLMNRSADMQYQALTAMQRGLDYPAQMAFHSALNWFRSGMQSVFLQDANTLVIKPDDLVAILEYLRQVFPQVERVTSYARSHSVAHISDEDMARLAGAGLNRIHIGMESGADDVLEFIKKGVDQQTQIVAGQKVKNAGIELSEYFMPGLGGREHSRVNALETAAAINQINPDFIRIRTLAVPPGVDLYQDMQSGSFKPLNDKEMAAELLLFIDNLRDISSSIKSDHILNLFQEVEGQLPYDHERMTAPIRKYMTLAPQEQLLYLVGRRTGIFSRLSDLDDLQLKGHAEKAMLAHRVTAENADAWSAEMMQRFI